MKSFRFPSPYWFSAIHAFMVGSLADTCNANCFNETTFFYKENNDEKTHTLRLMTIVVLWFWHGTVPVGSKHTRSHFDKQLNGALFAQPCLRWNFSASRYTRAWRCGFAPNLLIFDEMIILLFFYMLSLGGVFYTTEWKSPTMRRWNKLEIVSYANFIHESCLNHQILATFWLCRWNSFAIFCSVNFAAQSTIPFSNPTESTHFDGLRKWHFIEQWTCIFSWNSPASVNRNVISFVP